MAIAIVSTGTGAGAGPSSAFDVPLTVADPGAVILAAFGVDGNINVSPTVVWDSTTANSSFTLLATSTGRVCKVYQLIDPSTGAHSITFSGLSTTADKVGAGVVFSGVDSTTPTDAATASTVSGTSTTAVSTAIPSATGDLIYSAICINIASSSQVSAGNSGTLLTNSTTIAVSLVTSYQAGDTAVASSYTWSTLSALFGLVSINVNAAGGAAAVRYRPPSRSLMGVGR
jgi:hypothetical protein